MGRTGEKGSPRLLARSLALSHFGVVAMRCDAEQNGRSCYDDGGRDGGSAEKCWFWAQQRRARFGRQLWLPGNDGDSDTNHRIEFPNIESGRRRRRSRSSLVRLF